MKETVQAQSAAGSNALPSGPKAVRRVIAVSAAGGSKVHSDIGLPLYIDPKAGVGGAVLWSTSAQPRLGDDAGDVPVSTNFPPPPGETLFSMLNVAPGAVIHMHATDTIDQFVVVEGEIELILEQGPPTTLKVGDTVVMLGAQHKWANTTDKVAVGVLTSIGVAR